MVFLLVPYPKSNLLHQMIQQNWQHPNLFLNQLQPKFYLTAWVEASELEKKGEPHKLKKDIIETANNKPQYKGFVQVSERTIRRLVEKGIKPLERMNTIEANLPRLSKMLSTQTLTKTEKAIS